MDAKTAFASIKSHLQNQIVGQSELIQRLLTALLADGHLLVEGAPGLAKTRSIKALATGLDADFHRIQFTPDLLPADLIGSDVYRPEKGEFNFLPGPVFHNLILTDEINRAPAKVQSALLEAMGEHQVTVGATSHQLPRLFLVMATQNPIEQEGTYPLPEAQLDRFMLHVMVDYPTPEESRQIMELAHKESLAELEETTTAESSKINKLSEEVVFAARREVLLQHLSDPVADYMVELVEASRHPERYGADLAGWVRWGASPRGVIALNRCARAQAWLSDRDFVTPEDVQAVAPDILRHRILLDYEARADGITPQKVVKTILERVPSP